MQTDRLLFKKSRVHSPAISVQSSNIFDLLMFICVMCPVSVYGITLVKDKNIVISSL